MKKQEAAEILIQHNEYCRGGECAPYEPHIIGEALDLAIEALREQPAPPAIEWKPGPPDKKGDYLISSRHWPHPSWEMYEPDSLQWDEDEVLFHIGPIPKPPGHV